ncbi:hypothetical protein EVJ58_g1058 [Rhodofomes roseus]|uniref:UTP23 sensor motif region domain-containing protein n=1 Tax=Rhodofomes roseus TaxID=34475 RepID=A0A4Y9Z2Y2_9APHY|nr:hypothetical protein EVJ58_g1058 [Rhodofomes roseus]
MRQKRAKAYRKLMSLYCMSFGFRQPYQVLVDSEMCKSSITQKLELSKQLETVLQGTVKPMITQCCIHELYLQGKEQQPAVDLAKTFERRKCNHREAIPGDECLASVVGTSVMILEPPSKATLEAKESVRRPVYSLLLTACLIMSAKAEEQVLHPSAPEIATLPSTSTPAEAPKRKMKGPKGPNPLSVKKKKPKADPSAPNKAANESEQGHAGAKRTRGEDADGNVDGGEEPSSQGAGRKRKRRKKMGDNEPDHEPRGDTP